METKFLAVSVAREQGELFETEGQQSETRSKGDIFYDEDGETLEQAAQVDALSLETFKVRLDGTLSNMVQLKIPAHCRGGELDGL